MYAGGGTGGVGVLVFEFLCFKLDARHMEGAWSDAILRTLRVESSISTPQSVVPTMGASTPKIYSGHSEK